MHALVLLEEELRVLELLAVTVTVTDVLVPLAVVLQAAPLLPALMMGLQLHIAALAAKIILSVLDLFLATNK
jgi:hypothetical protein